MDILLLLIPVAMVLVAVIAGVFLWSVKSGQMEDLEGPAFRILMDDDAVKEVDNENKNLTESEKKIDL